MQEIKVSWKFNLHTTHFGAVLVVNKRNSDSLAFDPFLARLDFLVCAISLEIIFLWFEVSEKQWSFS